MASSVEAKIFEQETEIKMVKAKIVQIEKGEGIYSGLGNMEKLAAIKSKEDAIHDCNVAIDRLRQLQLQQGQFPLLTQLCFHHNFHGNWL